MKCKRVAIVSKQLSGGSSYCLNKSDLEFIMQSASSAECNLILFPGWTTNKRTFSQIKWENYPRIKWLVLELSTSSKQKQTKSPNGYTISIFNNTNIESLESITQQMQTGSERSGVLRNLNEWFSERVFGSTALLLCGEVNILEGEKQGRKIKPSPYLELLKKRKIRLILNQIHTPMKRWAKEKHLELSKSRRTLIATWNAINHQKAFRVFKNGKEIPRDSFSQVKKDKYTITYYTI